MNKRTTNRTRTTETRRGGVLVLTLTVVLIVGAMAGALLQLNSAATRRQAQSVDNKFAFYVAESGLTGGHLALLAGDSGGIGEESETLAETSIGRIGSNGGIQVHSTGSQRSIVRADLEAGPGKRIQVGGAADFEGEQNHLGEALVLPPVELPTIARTGP